MQSKIKIIFNLTIFLGSFLLFLIQPMLAKVLMPMLGGSQSIWIACVFFFQLFLLLGYLYAHVSHVLLGAKYQAILHAILLTFSCIFMPLGIKVIPDLENIANPASWIFWALTISVGVPFLLLSANAPMLQNWMAHINHKDAKNPYFLYIASNVGSFIALLSYPFALEPLMQLTTIMNLWTKSYFLMIFLIAICAGLTWGYFKDISKIRRTLLNSIKKLMPEFGDLKIWKTNLYWVVLAFIPSSLMLGVTTYITTDIAPMPLLWIVPLALYLLSFILAFNKRFNFLFRICKLSHNDVVLATILAMVMQVVLLIFYGLHLVCFFIISMVCHSLLAQSKPEPERLTAFYLYLSLGGALGGFFNVFLSPLIFNDIIEYPLVMIASLFLVLPVARKSYFTREFADKAYYMLTLMMIFYITYTVLKFFNTSIENALIEIGKNIIDAKTIKTDSRKIVAFILFLYAVFVLRKLKEYPHAYILTLAFVFLSTPFIIAPLSDKVIYKSRNFYGALEVSHNKRFLFNVLMHGTTIHGLQRLEKDKRTDPSSYYKVFIGIFNKKEKVAVIGLGTGTLACTGKKGSHFTFYDINKEVYNIATNPNLFTFLRDCPAKSEVVIGDGRIEINKVKDKTYDAIIIDAFSSDFIPIHLLTDEALEIYQRKIKPDGFVAFHVSNRFLNLNPVLRSLGKHRGMIVLEILTKKGDYSFRSSWVLMTRNPKLAKKLVDKHEWQMLKSRKSIRYWTDNYTNIFSVLK